MTVNRVFRSIAFVAMLGATLAPTGAVSAGGGCGSSVTAQWGDTLSAIASMCGTTQAALLNANPGVNLWLSGGQVIYIPSGTASYPTQAGARTYVVQQGDTLGGIALLNGVTFSDLLAANPQLQSNSTLYPGLVINLPAGSPGTGTPYVGNPFALHDFGNLKVLSKFGLLVRTGPGRNYSEIVSPLVSAVKWTRWQYRKSSLTTDSTNFVWVEIALGVMVNGRSTGWILVRDSLGNYFTDPSLGSPIDPNDP